MTTSTNNIETANLTVKEIETLNILVRLGDSKELALATVIAEREREVNVTFYENAYYN